MNIHRGIATAAFLGILATAACDGSSDDARPTPSASTEATTTPTVQASRDPAADRIPLAGDDGLEVTWVLDKVNGSDPVIDVARRTIALVVLSNWSTAWADDHKVAKAAAALADDDAVLVEPLRRAATPTKREDPQRVRLLVQAPTVTGDRATAWMCFDPDATSSRSESGVLISVTLAVTEGLWKATDYNLNPKITADVEARFKQCRAGY